MPISFFLSFFFLLSCLWYLFDKDIFKWLIEAGRILTSYVRRACMRSYNEREREEVRLFAGLFSKKKKKKETRKWHPWRRATLSVVMNKAECRQLRRRWWPFFFLVRRKRLCSLTTLLFSVTKARHVQYFATALRWWSTCCSSCYDVLWHLLE